MKLPKLIALTLMLAGTLAASVASAAHVLSFQNTTFTIAQVDNNTFTLRIQNALNANGDWGNANYLDNMAFKDIGTGFTGAVLTPGQWSYSANELSANGCYGGASGGLCFDAVPAMALTNDMLFTIDVLGANLNFAATGPHLKLRFLALADSGRKEGSLLSQSLPLMLPPDEFRVPEPASLFLLVLAMFSLSLMRRATRV